MESPRIKLTALQMSSTPDVKENLQQIEALLTSLINSTPQCEDEYHLVVLPECCLRFGGKDRDQLTLAEAPIVAQNIDAFCTLARKFNIFLVAGTIPNTTDNAEKFTASAFMISPCGTVLNEYQKMHLFDVEVNDNSKNYYESKYTQAGRSVVVEPLPFANVGTAVCYDMRFPELFRAMRSQGADIVCLPAAFTRVTGKAHWLTLLKARAIENQVYVVASAQEGIHANGRETWGHSAVIDPWGEVLDMCKTGSGWASAYFDRHRLTTVRQQMPVENHNQFQVSRKI